MPIESFDLNLIAQAASDPYLNEQSDALKLVEEVKRAAAQDRSGEQIFERYPRLAAAAYYFLDKSKYARTDEGQRTLGNLRATIHQAMSPGVNVEPSVQRAFSIDFRIRGLIHENPAAFYGLVHSLNGSDHPFYDHGSLDFIDRSAHHDLLGHYRFGINTILGIFGLADGHIFQAVDTHVMTPVNFDRFDGLVRKETIGLKMPEGVSIQQGIRTLFIQEGGTPLYSEIGAAIRYRDAEGALAPRRPGSGIEHFMDLNLSLREVTRDLVGAYHTFRDTGSEAIALEVSLYQYLKTAIGRPLPADATWDYLQEGQPGFPVRDAMIEALEVHAEEFDEVMTRAAKAGVFGMALQRQESRDSRRPESRRVK